MSSSSSTVALILISALSLGVSALSFGVAARSLRVSSRVADSQFAQFRRTNHFLAVAQLLSDFRSAEFHERYDYVTNKLSREHDPRLGLLGLPEPARSSVIDVAFYFQTFASLIEFGAIDETKNFGNLYLRIIEVWRAIEPYVLCERARSSGANKHTLGVLQLYAGRLSKLQSTPDLVV